MRKNNGLKDNSDATPSSGLKDQAEKIQKLFWAYEREMSLYARYGAFDFAVFMLYCSYVSRNADELGLEDFDTSFSIDEVKACLGNTYVAASFVEYYAGLGAKNDSLPDLRGIELRSHDLSKAIVACAELLEASELSLMESDSYEIASVIQLVLAEACTSGYWGKEAGEHNTPLSVADLATRLADVEGKTVLDFACGNGVYLAAALSRGSASVCGRDINGQAVMRAKISCFFADPTKKHDIATANALSVGLSTAPAQRVFVAPPLGYRLREFDLPDKSYYVNMVGSLAEGENAKSPDVEDFFVAKALASLTNDGIAILHVSASFLFRQQRARQALRCSLVEGGFLRTVIELPGGVIPGTGVKSALVVIGKQPTDDGVFIVDLDSKELVDKGYLAKGRGRCEITEAGIDWLARTVEQRDEIPLVSTIADREEILASGGNLCYSAYGDVFDYGSILDKTRTTEDIMGDIRAAQASINSLGEQIADILNSIEQKG
jgi:predicted RNA methylase